jgi:hypothetical protein
VETSAHNLARSKRKLAEALGVSDAAVLKWVRDDRWPFPKRPPWNIDAVRQWRANHLQPVPGLDLNALGNPSLERKAKIALIVERTKYLRQQREIEAGGFIRFEDVQAAMVSRIVETKYAIFATIRQTSEFLAGQSLTARQVREILEEHFTRMMNDIAKGKTFGGFDECNQRPLRTLNQQAFTDSMNAIGELDNVNSDDGGTENGRGARGNGVRGGDEDPASRRGRENRRGDK